MTNWRSGEYVFARSQEQAMKRMNWGSLVNALVLVRLGQELGTDSQLARTIHDLIQLVAAIWR